MSAVLVGMAVLAPAAKRVLRRYRPPQDEGGYLQLRADDVVQLMYQGSAKNNDQGWCFGRTAAQSLLN